MELPKRMYHRSDQIAMYGTIPSHATATSTNRTTMRRSTPTCRASRDAKRRGGRCSGILGSKTEGGNRRDARDRVQEGGGQRACPPPKPPNLPSAPSCGYERTFGEGVCMATKLAVLALARLKPSHQAVCTRQRGFGRRGSSEASVLD